MHPAEQYCQDVLSGKILACKWVKLACKRHIDDKKKAESGEIPYEFSEDSAEHVIRFFTFLKHSKGTFGGQSFHLEPWQQFILWCIFGWKNPDGTRRFRLAYIEVARKNGKSTLSSGIANYMFVADGEPGAEIYTTATTREQAKIVFVEAKNMVNSSPALKSRVQVYQHNMHIMASASKLEPLSADYNTLDGLNPHCYIIDEFHAHPNAELRNVMKSATGARSQPLEFTITTAGFNKQGPCFALRKSCLEILEGKAVDDSTFCMVFTLDEGDEWTDEANWIKANPNLDVSISLKYLRDQCNSAIIRPSEQVNFKTKNLNIWTDSSLTWIPDEKWQACEGEFPDLRGVDAYGGLDLASTIDVAAYVLGFALDGKFYVKPYFFIPEDTVRERSLRDRVNYDLWVKQGFMMVTPGNVTDYNFIKQKIKDLHELYTIKSSAYDRFNASQLVIDLIEEGITMSPFGQGFVSMSAPTKELEKLVIGKQLVHDGNPVLRWMCGNIEIRLDPAGNIKIDKAKSSEKVDGMVALVMSIGEYLTGIANNEGPSSYDQPGSEGVIYI